MHDPYGGGHQTSRPLGRQHEPPSDNYNNTPYPYSGILPPVSLRNIINDADSQPSGPVPLSAPATAGWEAYTPDNEGHSGAPNRFESTLTLLG